MSKILDFIWIKYQYERGDYNAQAVCSLLSLAFTENIRIVMLTRINYYLIKDKNRINKGKIFFHKNSEDYIE